MGRKSHAVPGLGAHRLTHPSSEREVAFVEQWAAEWTDILGHLLVVPAKEDEAGAFPDPYCINAWQRCPLGAPTLRDRQIAATVIQWLGTNVGMCFLDQALARAGYRVVRIPEERVGQDRPEPR